jgi:hypothetical protein
MFGSPSNFRSTPFTLSVAKGTSLIVAPFARPEFLYLSLTRSRNACGLGQAVLTRGRLDQFENEDKSAACAGLPPLAVQQPEQETAALSDNSITAPNRGPFENGCR